MDSLKLEMFREPKRREIINGKIYLMAGATDNHIEAVGNLFFIFKNYLRGKKCRVFGENYQVRFDKESREILPDIKIVCDPNKIKRTHILGAPDLIIEVLSENTENRDKGEKKDLYEKYGVKEYWLVDTNSKKIEVYLLKNDKYTLDYIYKHYSEEEIVEIEEDDDEENEEKKRIKITTIKTSLYGDELIINIADIFENIY